MTPDDLKTIASPRFFLVSLSPADWVRVILTAGLISFVFILFHFLGTPDGYGPWGRSALLWLTQRWGDSGISMGSGDYSHGFLVPLASLYVVWTQRDAFLRCPKRETPIGLVFRCLFWDL